MVLCEVRKGSLAEDKQRARDDRLGAYFDKSPEGSANRRAGVDDVIDDSDTLALQMRRERGRQAIGDGIKLIVGRGRQRLGVAKRGSQLGRDHLCDERTPTSGPTTIFIRYGASRSAS